MIYFWGGPKKQNDEQLQKSLDALNWQQTTHPEKFQNDLDETAIKALLEACIMRNMKKYDSARTILKDEVLNHEK